MNTKKIAMLSMLLALSVVLNLLESTIPIIGNVIPGVKLGLANTVILFAIYTFSFKDALYISITRVFLVGLLRTGLFGITFFFSLGGSILSVICMYLTKKYTSLSIIGVSVIGAISHSIGQILMGIIILKTTTIIFYLPLILLLSIPTGIMIGMVTTRVLSYYKNSGNRLQ
jgi:heptaprenyl diphosphate synthase